MVDNADQHHHHLDHHGVVGQFYKTNATPPVTTTSTGTNCPRPRYQSRRRPTAHIGDPTAGPGLTPFPPKGK